MRKKRQKIYIMSSSREPGLYKIGISNNPGRRRKQIDESMPGLINTIFSFPLANAAEFEKFLHHKHRSINHPMKKGSGRTEWFDPGKTMLWPSVGMLAGLIVGAAIGYPITMAVIGFTGYGIIFFVANIAAIVLRFAFDALPAIVIIAAILLGLHILNISR